MNRHERPLLPGIIGVTNQFGNISVYGAESHVERHSNAMYHVIRIVVIGLFKGRNFRIARVIINGNGGASRRSDQDRQNDQTQAGDGLGFFQTQTTVWMALSFRMRV